MNALGLDARTLETRDAELELDASPPEAQA